MFADKVAKINIVDISSQDYYGTGYQDVSARVPSIKNAHACLDWQPKVGEGGFAQPFACRPDTFNF